MRHRKCGVCSLPRARTFHPNCVEAPLPRPSLQTGEAGLTLVEVTIALSLLTLSVLGFGASYVVNSRSSDTISEKSLVVHTVRQLVERMRGDPFDSVVANYQGLAFTIPELNATGTVTIFVNETTNSADSNMLGLPRDLDGDGLATAIDVSADYILVPIKIEVTYVDPIVTTTEKFFFFMAQESN